MTQNKVQKDTKILFPALSLNFYCKKEGEDSKLCEVDVKKNGLIISETSRGYELWATVDCCPGCGESHQVLIPTKY